MIREATENIPENFQELFMNAQKWVHAARHPHGVRFSNFDHNCRAFSLFPTNDSTDVLFFEQQNSDIQANCLLLSSYSSHLFRFRHIASGIRHDTSIYPQMGICDNHICFMVSTHTPEQSAPLTSNYLHRNVETNSGPRILWVKF